MNIIVNTNGRRTVRLTPAGRRTLQLYWGYYDYDTIGCLDDMHPGWNSGEVRFQIHGLMLIFGPKMNGMEGPQFECNVRSTG